MTHSAAAIAQGIALRANIIAVLTARPGLSTAELCHSIADAPPMRVTGVAGKLRDQQILRSERSLTTTRSGAQRIGCRWFIADQPKPPRVYANNQPEKADGPGVEAGDRAWQAHWHPSNRAERRQMAARPDYIAAPPSGEPGYALHEI